MKIVILFALGAFVSSQQDPQKIMMLENEIMELEDKKSNYEDEIYDYQDANNVIQGNINATQIIIKEATDRKMMADKLTEECLEDKKLVENELKKAEIRLKLVDAKRMVLTDKAKEADRQKMLLEPVVDELERQKMAIDEVNQMENATLANRQMELSTLKSQVEDLMDQIKAARDRMQRRGIIQTRKKQIRKIKVESHTATLLN